MVLVTSEGNITYTKGDYNSEQEMKSKIRIKLVKDSSDPEKYSCMECCLSSLPDSDGRCICNQYPDGTHFEFADDIEFIVVENKE